MLRTVASHIRDGTVINAVTYNATESYAANATLLDNNILNFSATGRRWPGQRSVRFSS
jgi:hypothetical protein